LRLCDPAHTTDASAGAIWLSRGGCRRGVDGCYSGRDGETTETIQITSFDNGGDEMEIALGRLINTLNPYSNPQCAPFNEDRRMQFAAGAPGQGIAGDDAGRLAQIAVEIDNYQGGDWTFMGQMYKIKRALLIPYRYEVLGGQDRNMQTGIWATGNLLIGYTGANG